MGLAGSLAPEGRRPPRPILLVPQAPGPELARAVDGDAGRPGDSAVDFGAIAAADRSPETAEARATAAVDGLGCGVVGQRPGRECGQAQAREAVERVGLRQVAVTCGNADPATVGPANRRVGSRRSTLWPGTRPVGRVPGRDRCRCRPGPGQRPGPCLFPDRRRRRGGRRPGADATGGWRCCRAVSHSRGLTSRAKPCGDVREAPARRRQR